MPTDKIHHCKPNMKFYKNKHPEYQFTTELVELNCHCVGEDGSVYEYQAIEWEENSNEGILVHVVEYEELEDAVKDYKQIEQEINERQGWRVDKEGFPYFEGHLIK